jgi:hypothetical protein
MNKSASRIALFGGALFTAGLADAQPQFTHIDGPQQETYAYAYDYNTTEVAYGFGGIETLMFTAGESTATAAIEPTRLLASGQTGGTGDFSRGTALIGVSSSVNENVVALVEWDFEDDIFGLVEIVDPRIGSHIFRVAGTDTETVGTAMVPLEAGVNYRFSLRTPTGGGSGPRSTIAVITLPQPCPADVNGDGMLTPSDFSAWIAAFNTQAPGCDQNGDGQCFPNDFSAWVGNFNAGC